MPILTIDSRQFWVDSDKPLVHYREKGRHTLFGGFQYKLDDDGRPVEPVDAESLAKAFNHITDFKASLDRLRTKYIQSTDADGAITVADADIHIGTSMRGISKALEDALSIIEVIGEKSGLDMGSVANILKVAF